MPFHSVKTEFEADDLVVLHCKYKLGEYRVEVDWDNAKSDACSKGCASAARQFGLEPTIK